MRSVTEADQAIGLRIREARKKNSVSMHAVAEALVVSVQQMMKYEAGQNRISAANLVIVSKILRVDLRELAGIDIVGETSGQLTARAEAIAGLFDMISDKAMQDAIYRFIQAAVEVRRGD